jgi:hypothetical protein
MRKMEMPLTQREEAIESTLPMNLLSKPSYAAMTP